MNIVFGTDQYWPTISGVSVSIDIFRNEFLKKGHSVSILCPEHPDFSESDLKNESGSVYRFKSLPVFFTKENRLVRFAEKRKIFMLLDRLNPDIIHIHSEFPMGKMCMSYARSHGIPLIITAHTNWEELLHIYVPFFPPHLARIYTRIRLKNFYNKCNLIIAPTSLMETLLLLYFVTKPTIVIPTGIIFDKKVQKKKSEQKFLDSPLYKQFPALKKKRILFFAGRLGREKNIPFLIEVLGRIKDQFSDVVLVIAGGGPELENLAHYVESKNLSRRVFFTGFVEKSKINLYYRAAEVFVFASKVESQGLVVLEAMAQGVPVVAIGKMGTREVMSGDNGGYMVDDDLDMFSQKVSLLLENKSLYAAKSIEALHHAGKWSIDSLADKTLAVYRKYILAAGISQ